MKKLIYILLVLALTAVIALSLASCSSKETDAAVADARAELDAEISTLNSRLDTLNQRLEELQDDEAALKSERETLEGNAASNEAALTALEGAIAELKAEKAELEGELAGLADALEHDSAELCARGIHLHAPGSEIVYEWESDRSCYAFFDCSICKEVAYRRNIGLSADALGNFTAEFGGNIPSATIVAPVITSITFNSDSPAYDAESGIFTISASEPLIFTIRGENLQTIKDNPRVYSFCFESYRHSAWTELYKMHESEYVIYKEDGSIDVIFPSSLKDPILDSHLSVSGGAIYDTLKRDLIAQSTVKISFADPEDVSWTTVTTSDELFSALPKGGYVRLGCDIQLTEIIFSSKEFTLDLAGYTITAVSSTSFSISPERCEIRDSVGGGRIIGPILMHSGTIKFRGNFTVESEYPFALKVSGTIDLIDYTGDNLNMYIDASTVDLYVPHGYYLLATYSNQRVEGLEAAKEKNYVTLRKEAEPNT